MEDDRTRTVGYVGPRSVAEGRWRPAHAYAGVAFDSVPGFGVQSMDRSPGWHNAIRGTKAAYLREVPKLTAERKWDGLFIEGAPIELMNPGLFEDLSGAVDIPVATAMVSCVAALKAFGAERAALITGFFDGLDEMLYGYFCHDGIELLLPKSKPFPDYTSGSQANPQVIFDFTRQTVEANPGVQAVYFQGSLDTSGLVKRVETELGLPVVSGSAYQWYILSRLGKTFNVDGGGRLLEEWPSLPK